MQKIPVYTAEKSDGLEAAVSKNSVISYTPILFSDKLITPTLSFSQAVEKFSKDYFTSEASLGDPDLYSVNSILVSTGKNKNDEIFLKEELWAAKSTASHKRTNLNHEELSIIGHMMDTWAIDDSGNVIAEDTKVEDLPDVFHIVNSSVIYLFWENKDRGKEVAELVKAIEDGKKFVSMECFFTDFDYGVTTSEGKNVIIVRSEETAFLTKHLRIYGGSGEYKGCKIGRIPRNMIFSGKGFVDNPANPDSVILSKNNTSFIKNTENNSSSETLGVLINCSEVLNSTEKQIMADNANDTPVVDVKEFETLKASAANLNASLDSIKAEKVALEAKLAETQKSLTETSEAKTKVETELNQIKLENLKAGRAIGLVDGGYTQDEAKTLVEKFINLNDEQFTTVAESLLVAKKPVQVEKPKETLEEVNASTKTLESAKVESTPTLAVETEGNDEAEKKQVAAKAALVDFISKKINGNSKKIGE